MQAGFRLETMVRQNYIYGGSQTDKMDEQDAKGGYPG